MDSQRRKTSAGKMDRVEKLGDRAVLGDFLRTRWVWLFLAAAVLLAVTIALVVVFLFTNPSDEAAEARDACQHEVERQLKDAPRFVFENDESFEESGNTWNISGTVRFAGTDLRDYECVYTGKKVVDVQLQKR